jgi:hypothetical protein
MKKIVYIVGLAVLASCSSGGEEKGIQDDQFCKCLEVGDELNAFSSEVLDRTPTPEDQEKMKVLREKKKEACKNYETMSGEEMMKRKMMCK